MVMAEIAQVLGGRLHRGWPHPFLSLLFLLLIVVAIGAAIWALVRTKHPTVPVQALPPTDPAMNILRTRFAQGEIDAEEFAARRAQLAGMVVPPPPASPPNA